jgi:hypothetical protein
MSQNFLCAVEKAAPKVEGKYLIKKRLYSLNNKNSFHHHS